MLAQAALSAAPFPHQRTESSPPAAPTAAWWQRPGRHSAGLHRRRCQPAGAPPKVAVAASYGGEPGQRQPSQEPDKEPPHGLRRLLNLALTVLLSPFMLLAKLLFVDPPDDLPDGAPADEGSRGTAVKYGFLFGSSMAVLLAVAHLATLQAPPRVEALASVLTGGSRAAEVLAACSFLPLVPSPAMTIAAILVIYLHYRAIFWFQYWHTHAYPRLATSALSAAWAEAEAPVTRMLHWLLCTPRGHALFWVLLLYGGVSVQVEYLARTLAACLIAIPTFFV